LKRARPASLSVNVARRNLTKGQQAMASAMMFPEPKMGRPEKGRKSELSSDFSTKRQNNATGTTTDLFRRDGCGGVQGNFDGAHIGRPQIIDPTAQIDTSLGKLTVGHVDLVVQLNA
jgi:hypothetical protein